MSRRPLPPRRNPFDPIPWIAGAAILGGGYLLFTMLPAAGGGAPSGAASGDLSSGTTGDDGSSTSTSPLLPLGVGAAGIAAGLLFLL